MSADTPTSDKERIISQAPGRVCLFGEHQDYLGLPVIAAAIDRHLSISATKNSSDCFHISMPDIGQTREIWIHDELGSLQRRDYYGSALRVLRRYGCIPDQGYSIEVTGNIPINAGAASSSALTVAWVHLLLHMFGADAEVGPMLVARISYESEVTEHGEPGGMMDHLTASLGNIVFIDTKDNWSTDTLGSSLGGLILADSKVPKETLGMLSRVRRDINASLDMVKKRCPDFSFQDALLEDMPAYSRILSGNGFPCFAATVENHHITGEALRELRKTDADLRRIGDLMNKHHSFLKDSLRITVPKIDLMIDAALDAGALGAKINGSGGGGCIVALAPGRVDQVAAALRDVGAEPIPVAVDSGAKIVR